MILGEYFFLKVVILKFELMGVGFEEFLRVEGVFGTELWLVF